MLGCDGARETGGKEAILCTSTKLFLSDLVLAFSAGYHSLTKSPKSVLPVSKLGASPKEKIASIELHLRPLPIVSSASAREGYQT